MANSSYVDYKDTISMLTNVQYGAWIVIDSSSIPVYGDVAKIPDSLLGNVKGPVKVQSTAYKAVDGKHYISVLLPSDNVGNNWEGSHYVWIEIGTDDSGVAKLYTGNDNKSYIKKTKVDDYEEHDAGRDLVATPKFVKNGRADLNRIQNISEWSSKMEDLKNESESEEGAEGENAVARIEAYAVEDYWITDATSTAEAYSNAVSNMNDLKKLRFIFGLPYQFLPTADMRIQNSNINSAGEDEIFGITYAEKIASRMPLLYLTPGNSRFLADNTSSERQGAISNIIDHMFGGNDGNLNDLLDGYSGKLYSIQPAYNEYFQYVNPMCRIGAVLLGLDHVATGQDKRAIANDFDTEAEYNEYRMLDGRTCSDYNWAWADNSGEDDSFKGDNETNSAFEKVVEWAQDTLSWIYYRQVIPFYITSESQYSDNFSNETTESTLASKVNGFSDAAREMQFLMGTTSSMIAEDFDALGDVFANSRKAIDDFTSKLAGNGNIFSSLLGSLKTVATGGRLQFPNIWSNASYNKSYQINIKLTTPYYDVKSWWLNIYVPLCHLIGLVMPRGEYHNGYSAPFLVKAFYKGSFNIDMGIITEMTINKGKEGGWTKDGLPTVVDVSFTIQDLYSSISMSPITLAKSNTLENIQELDYLCSLCGININEPELTRLVKLYATLNITSKWVDIPFNLTSGMTQRITSRISSIYSML
jgi:hypothetical protein